jgi:hypothetical protein
VAVRVIAFVLVVLLAGCYNREAMQQQLSEYNATVPRCLDADECEMMWAAARRWVQQHSGFRIDTYSDDYIQTHKSGDYANTLLGVEVWKDPIGGGMYEIRTRMWRNNAFSQGDIPQKMLDFNRYVAAAGRRG